MSMHEKVNILMVDDQVGKLLSYEAILGDLGENLLKAHSGKEALEILLRTEVAVVLLDVSMPELDGYDLAEMIREHPRFQRTPIIFISAVLMTDVDRLKGYERGAVDYISVPVVPELLRAKVSVFVDLHRKTKQLETLNLQLRRLSSSLIAAQDQERRPRVRPCHQRAGHAPGDTADEQQLPDRPALSEPAGQAGRDRPAHGRGRDDEARDRGDPLHAGEIRHPQRDQEGEPAVDELTDDKQAQHEEKMRQAD